MTCSLCGQRKAKRACPGVRDEICAVCCGTKRLRTIPCPVDCIYLDAAQRHPAAAVKRQLDLDAAVVRQAVGAASDEQLQLFFVVQTFITRFAQRAPAAVTDTDVGEAVAALAEGYEVHSRGLVYEPQVALIGGEALRRELKAFFDEIGKSAPARLERALIPVLRAIERLARHEVSGLAADSTAYLTMAARILQERGPIGRPPSSSLILPP